MKSAVTGGGGFIGSVIIRYIMRNSDDSDVYVGALCYAGNTEALREIDSNDRYAFEHVDNFDRKALARAIANNQLDSLMNFLPGSSGDAFLVGIAPERYP